MSEQWGFETRQIHAGAEPDPATGARAVPIYQTTSYQFRDTEHAANLFALAEVGNVYTRIMNPTQGVLEARLNSLEGGVTTAIGLPGTLVVGSGQAAETLAILNLASAGDHIVSSSSLYGGTYNLFHYTLPKLGIEVTFVDDPDDLEQWRAAVQDNTKAFFGETIPNPKNDVFDIEGVSGVAHAEGLPLIIDNTVPSPYLIRPLEWGADVVVHSLTKFLGGHGNSIGGAIIDGGGFDFGASGRFPGFTEPDPSYHGLAYWPALGPGSFALKARVQLLRDIGAPISPFNAFLILQGIETLSLRMERHFANAQKVAEYLVGQGQVLSVNYAGLPGNRWYERATKLRRREGLRLRPGVRDRGRPGGRQALRRGARAAQPRRQHRRRPQPRDPPGEHDAQPADGRGAAGVGRPPRPRPPQRRHRDDRRHPRRPGQGLRRRQALTSAVALCGSNCDPSTVVR